MIVNSITETSRLEIVEVTISDYGLLYQLTGDNEVMKFFPKILNLGETKEMVHKILAQYERYGHCFWKVQLKPKGEFIGIAGLLHQEIDGIVETEISYRIKSKYWNNGYATEAARACRA
ncbi:MAG: GNAT family N-acetyltransferase [Desulforhopalus sp.]|nr:GNAT family N-acetyltransferase [Desulforhopalus sp.]